jgi:hypothetical protein
MEHLLGSHLSFIKKDRSYIFWLAFVNSVQAEDDKLTKSWLKVAASQVNEDELSNLHFPEVDLEVDEDLLDEQVDWIEVQFQNSRRHELIGSSKEKIRELIKHYSTNGHLTDGVSGNGKLLLILGLFGLNYQLKQVEKDPFANLSLIEEMFTDKKVKDQNKLLSSDLMEGGNKKILAHSVFNQLNELFKNQSDYFYHQLTGYILVCLNKLDTEDQHNDSPRTASYNEYLINDVKQILQRNLL